MWPKRLAIALLLSLAPITMAAHGVEGKAKPVPPSPKPELTPGQVVEIQVEALQYNDRPSKDAGIATTFQFASPTNREATGPLERFTLIVKGPAYRPLIGHRIAGYSPTVERGSLAVRLVTIVAADGQAIDYLFQLSKDPKSGCWFTDGVAPVPAKPKIDPGKVARNAQTLPIAPPESLLHLL
jgi:Domain of unknown function (DUF4864)